jgi:hypothetical protein
MYWLLESHAVPRPEIDYTQRELEDVSLRETIARQLQDVQVHKIGLHREWDLAIRKGRDENFRPISIAVLSDETGPVWTFHTHNRSFSYAWWEDYLVATDLHGVMVFQLSQQEMTLHEMDIAWGEILISPTGEYLAAVTAEWAQPDMIRVYRFTAPLTSLEEVCVLPTDTLVRWESPDSLLHGTVVEEVRLPGHALDGRNLLSLSVQDLDEIEREEGLRKTRAFFPRVHVEALKL